MIPTINILTEQITFAEYPSRTYKLDLDNDKINGYVDEVEAIIQSIYLILHTERYKHLIYSWDYGVELEDLFGQPMSYVISELERRIREALVMDDRIDDVNSFVFTPKGHSLHVTFTVVTNAGNIPTEMEVEI